MCGSFALVTTFSQAGRDTVSLWKSLLINVFLTWYDSVVLSVFLSLILSIHFSQLKVAGGLKPIPAVTGWKVGYTLVRSPLYCRANTHRQLLALAVTPVYLTYMSLGYGRNSEYPERTGNRENMETPHRTAQLTAGFEPSQTTRSFANLCSTVPMCSDKYSVGLRSSVLDFPGFI